MEWNFLPGMTNIETGPLKQIRTTQLQSLISRALDDDNHVVMASLDLSVAFDVVDMPLLVTRLNMLGLPAYQSLLLLCLSWEKVEN